MGTNKSNHNDNNREEGGKDLHGKEKEEEEISISQLILAQPKSNMRMPTVKELLYGFLVIFLLLIVYVAGQMQTSLLINYVNSVCPNPQITSASPFTGISFVPNATKIQVLNISNFVLPKGVSP